MSKGTPRDRPGKKRVAAKLSKRAPKASKKKRLGPGELDKLVLGYMRRHKKPKPHTPSTVAKAINRSSGAVANCLVRLERKEKVRLVEAKPRKYELVEAKKQQRAIAAWRNNRAVREIPDPR